MFLTFTLLTKYCVDLLGSHPVRRNTNESQETQLAARGISC